jgi:hypothetical protein
MKYPAIKDPKVLPTNAGTRREPAAEFEAPRVTWKYRGTENIIYKYISYVEPF